ncbi:MBL fold metallo-hydrolase [Bacillus sp. Marseille-P3661]|uniref:MBL fold metallo-hydrolase n=1 Tax=Bacillus sp. Marseille-P3661 TaxID=1936234 RepID=UPI000C861E5D|nr:MBL fold metallo-hydrolase [Bacillus sp. Marseille-P3661]
MESQIIEMNGIYQFILPTPFPVGPVNVYLIKGDSLTLVDTGPKSKVAWGLFCELLDKVGYKPEDIDQVVLTHHHPDHVGMLEYMPKDIKIIGHYKNNPWIHKEELFIQRHELFFIEFFKNMGIEEQLCWPLIDDMKGAFEYSCNNRFITTVVKEGDEIPGIHGWNVYETPGHAGSHIILFHEHNALMIAGDLLIENTSPNPFIEPPYPGETERSKSLPLYLDSLSKCLQFDMRLVLSGHGKAIKDPYMLIHSQFNKQEERAQRIYEWLKEKPMSAFELNEKLYPSLRYRNQLGLTIFATVGQLDVLEQKQAVYIEKTEDVWKFFVR